MTDNIENAGPRDTLDRATRDALLHRMVEGLHALVYGTYSVGSGDYALKALGDGGSLHEYVHGMLWLLPPRIDEQVQSGGLPPGTATPTVPTFEEMQAAYRAWTENATLVGEAAFQAGATWMRRRTAGVSGTAGETFSPKHPSAFDPLSNDGEGR